LNTRIIAEVGVNHDGKLEKAFKLVDEAQSAGADAVKFQSFQAIKLANKNTPKVIYQERDTSSGSHYEMLKKLELSFSEQKKLINYCVSKKIDFISTPYDEESALFLHQAGVKEFKVASADIIDFQLNRRLSDISERVIISTGMSTAEEIEECTKLYENTNVLITLLHCVSNYPCSDESLNLNNIKMLNDRFGYDVGFSDHSVSHMAAKLAVAMGCKVLERHFTLNKFDEGPDHLASDDPELFAQYVQGVRKAENMLGSYERSVQGEEIQMRSVSRKSLFWQRNIKKGSRLKENDFQVLRPGNGISPMELPNLIDKTLAVDVFSGAKVDYMDFEK
jgi:sialic acid synthase SpsE